METCRWCAWVRTQGRTMLGPYESTNLWHVVLLCLYIESKSNICLFRGNLKPYIGRVKCSISSFRANVLLYKSIYLSAQAFHSFLKMSIHAIGLTLGSVL